jgi:hypothetical protein
MIHEMPCLTFLFVKISYSSSHRKKKNNIKCFMCFMRFIMGKTSGYFTFSR